MLAFRPTVLAFALLMLTSCAYSPGDSGFPWARCKVDSSEYLQGVDWEKAQKINLRVRQGDFLPTYIGLYLNHSYILTIENGDDSHHSFRAMDFFRAVAIDGLRVADGDYEKIACLDGISLPPRKSVELRFVAIRDGSYEFDDNSLMVSLAMVGNGGGFITIEPRRTISESPIKHLLLRESKPLVIDREEARPTGLFDDQEEESAPSPGLFDDEEETPAAPTGLFDDQEEAPDDAPPSGLFDDEVPEQPIDSAPSLPVEVVPPLSDDAGDTPTESLFGEPAIEPEESLPEAPQVEAAPQMPDEAPDAPIEGLFDSEPDQQAPELPVVDKAPQQPAPEQPAPDEEMFAEPEEELFVEEVPMIEVPVEKAPEPQPLPPAATVEPEPQAPATLPDDYQPVEGPPADIFSDPPDVVKTGPGTDGDSGEDRLGSSG
jgi:hypothetical protein